MHKWKATACRSLVAVLISPAGLTFADQTDPWHLKAGVSTLTDSNLFRTDEGTEVDDQITSSFVSLQVDKEISRQRFYLDARFTNNQFDKNDYLDYPGKYATGIWHWAFASRMKGKLGADYNEQINNFVDYTGREKNLRTTERYYFNVDWNLVGRWWLVSGVSHYQQENSALFLLEADYRSDSLDLGVKYEDPAGHFIEMVVRHTDGTYDNRVINPQFQIDSGFEQQTFDVRYSLQATGKTRISGNVGYTNREHDHYGDRDCQGPIGSLKLDYTVGGSVRILATLRQDLVSYQSSPPSDINLYRMDRGYYNSSYYRQRVADVGPLWQFSSKISFQALLRREERDYLGGLVVGLPERSDTLDSFVLMASWVPIDNLELSFRLQEDTRDSNRNGADFISDMATLSLALVF